MSDGAIAQQLIREAVGPISPGEQIGSQIRRAARKLGWTHSRTKALWYGEARRVDANEMRRLEETAERKAHAAKTELDDALKRVAAAFAAEAAAGDRDAADALIALRRKMDLAGRL